MPTMPKTPARPAPIMVGIEAPPVEEEEAPLLPLPVVSEELPEVVLAPEDEEEPDDERVAVAFAEELPATMPEMIEEAADAVELPLGVVAAVGAAVMLEPPVASSVR